MNKSDLDTIALNNYASLCRNPYPGRGIIVGLDETGQYLVQLYWIMGRSANSRNRIFTLGENGLVATEAADPSKVEDPSLIIYNAMGEEKGQYVVSNGHQTDAVIAGIVNDGVLESYGRLGVTFAGVMRSWTYEPDMPNFTSRITAVSSWWLFGKEIRPFSKMSILRKSPWHDGCDRHLYEFEGHGPGFGHCITTYSGDGDPLPSFQGEPILLPLVGSKNKIAETYWNALNVYNTVSLAVKFIPKDGASETVIINKYCKV